MTNKQITFGDGSQIIIRRGKAKDAMMYLQACQCSSELAYYDSALGTELNLFSEEHYFHPDAMNEWNTITSNEGSNHWWVAETREPQPKIVGGISIKQLTGYCEGRGFYVLPEWQGRGVGRALWNVGKKRQKGPLVVEVYAHAKQTIAYYESQGATRTGRQRLIHWTSWPAGVNLIASEFVLK